MSFRETKEAIEQLLRRDLEFGPFQDELAKLCRSLFVDIDRLQRDLSVQTSIEQVKKALTWCLNYAVESELSRDTSKFLVNFARLVWNWNMNSHRDPRIKRDAELLDRITRQHLAILDAVAVLRSLNKRVMRWIRYSPPAFRLARHFLESVFEEQQSP